LERVKIRFDGGGKERERKGERENVKSELPNTKKK